MTIRYLVKELFPQLIIQKPTDFVGLGIIIYNEIQGLPIIPLGSHLNARPKLPISGIVNISSTLASLATRANPMHDGFHLIEASTGNLTHIAQFVSPPLDSTFSNQMTTSPQGARQMTALLTSALPHVVISAAISSNGTMHLYENGKEHVGSAYN